VWSFGRRMRARAVWQAAQREGGILGGGEMLWFLVGEVDLERWSAGRF
jgi:hypothetical protein